MNYRSLVNLADKAFNTFEKPKQIYKSRSEDRTISDAQQRLQAEFVGRSKSELTRYECGVLIFENGAVSDDAYLYFLPRLCEAVFFEGADEFLFGDLTVEKHCAADDLADIGPTEVCAEVGGDRCGVDGC